MFQGMFRLLAAAVLALSLTGYAFAEEIKGTISKVSNEGREITVKAKGGKEQAVKISGSRTALEGVKSRSDLKEGQNVTVEHEGGEAKKIKVSK